jgi:TonB family protein
MKAIIPLCLLCLFIYGCSGTEKKKTTYENGQIKKRWYEKHITPEKVVFDGRYEEWYPNGRKCEEGEFINGVKNGKWIEWYDDGQKQKEREYVNGKENGKYIFWYRNGQKCEECEFIDGVINGKWIAWDENGQKKEEGEYLNGMKNGKWITWHNNGQTMYEEEYVKGIGEDHPDINAFISVEKEPSAVKTIQPVYPELAKRAGVEGKVFVKALVDKKGKVKTAVIFKSDAEIFNQVSLDAAYQWIFKPAIKNNRPVTVWVTLPFDYQLKNK